LPSKKETDKRNRRKFEKEILIPVPNPWPQFLANHNHRANEHKKSLIIQRKISKNVLVCRPASTFIQHYAKGMENYQFSLA
jgi:hypothetical protein